MGGRGMAQYPVKMSGIISALELLDEEDVLDLPEETSLKDNRPIEFEGEKRYVVQSRHDFSNGRSYGLLDKTGRDWKVITRSADEFDVLSEDARDRFGMERPTLSWAKDGKAVHIYVEGMDTDAFLAQAGLEVDLQNTTTTSKRLSRLFRPQAVTAWFDADAVVISHELSQPLMDWVADPERAGEQMEQWGTGQGEVVPADVIEQVWDGAGVVSRQMLLKMIDELPSDMDADSYRRQVRDLKYAKRVEFTVMTGEGQLKGHAVVHENLKTDFIMPHDVKAQVKLSDDDKRYVAFEFPHGHDQMQLDIQSAINLSPFFEGEQLVQWMEEDFAVFEDAVKTGDIAAGMAKLDRHTKIEDIKDWALREFVASGGDIHWSGSFVKSYMNQYIKRVSALTEREGKLKLPIPGGRYYVMPSLVGMRAGIPMRVERGEVLIDPDTETAWVNDQDWVELKDSASYGNPEVKSKDRWGIANILGGADNDDALWLHPFRDSDQEKKVLLWRSPNESGEYVTLKPAEGSAALAWKTVEGEVSYPVGDSSRLGVRADRLKVDDLGLIDLDPQVDDRPPTASTQLPLHEAMRQAAQREKTNAALLGSVCNYQMVHKAVYASHPPQRPAPLEEVIDLKKTGADGQAVADWVWGKRKGLLNSGVAIPRLLADRVSTQNQRAVTTDGSHWLDKIESAIESHVGEVKAIRDEMVGATRPPKELFDYVFERPESVEAGRRLNQGYAYAVKQRLELANREQRKMGAEDWSEARQAVELELEKIAPADRGRALLGSIVSVHMAEDPGSDGVAWLMGGKDAKGVRQAGLAQETLAEMRQAGLLSELIPDPSGRGVIQYPATKRDVTASRTVGVNGVWRNFFDYMAEAGGLASYDNWDDSTAEGKKSKKRFSDRAKKRVQSYMNEVGSMELVVREVEWGGKLRKGVYSTRTDKRVGTIAPGDEDVVEVGQIFTIDNTLASDGNIRGIVTLD